MPILIPLAKTSYIFVVIFSVFVQAVLTSWVQPIRSMFSIDNSHVLKVPIQ